ncbi:hydrolase 76 protein [Kappamyces sp. JEL0829]|nr:hydrolase 76 protein [Kappamyces sp. JEL0829]
MFVFGPDANVPGGQTFSYICKETFNEVFEYWDTKCGGGLYWSRNPAINPGYKSTITNAEAMLVGAQLAIATGNQTYNQRTADTYAWLKSSGIITADWQVNDGIQSANACTLTTFHVSYEPGMLIGALAWMYKATGQTSYLSDATALLTATLKEYASSGILTDPCEPSECPLNSVSPKGELIRGMSYLWEFASDPTVRSTIKTVLQQSVSAMIKTCDSDWNCGNNWASGVPNTGGKSVHDQMNAVQLLTGYYKTFGNPLKGNLTTPTGSSNGTTGSGNVNPLPKGDGLALSLSPLISFIAVLTAWIMM